MNKQYEKDKQRNRGTKERRPSFSKNTPHVWYVFGKYPVVHAITSPALEKKILYLQEGLRDTQTCKTLTLLAQKQGIPVRIVSRQRIEQIEGMREETHQGYVLEVSVFRYTSFDAVSSQAQEKKESLLLVVLDRIQDPHNVGAIIRSAEAMGAHGVVVERRGGCPMTGTIMKTSAGLAAVLPILQVDSLRDFLIRCKKQDFQIVSLDFPAEKSLEAVNFLEPTLLVVGHEGDGVHPVLRKIATTTALIPCPGTNQSLNVSVATAIALYECARQRKGIKE